MGTARVDEDQSATKTTGWWCRHCGQPARHVGGGGEVPENRRAVHALTGRERGDGDPHIAAPVNYEPPLWKAAREITAAYRGAFRVTARFRLLRADWSTRLVDPGVTPEHFTSHSAEEMYAQLDATTAGTEWARELEAAPR